MKSAAQMAMYTATAHSAAHTGLRHSAIPLQRQNRGDHGSDRGSATTENDLPSERSTCTPCGASDLSNPKPFHQ